MEIDAAIVAGGQGSRMGGVRKSLLEVGGRRIIDRQIEVLSPLVGEIWLVDRADGGHPEVRGTHLIRDRVAGAGPLGAIEAAFAASTADALMVFGCDWPYLDPRIVSLVRDAATGLDIVAPRVGGRVQPLHARYARSVHAPVARLLAEGRLRLLGLLDQPGLVSAFVEEPALRALDPELRSMTNVNTPAELR